MSQPPGEAAYIEWMRRQTPADSRIPLGPGDDAAVVRIRPGADLLVTTDMLLDGSCFRLAEAGPFRVGRKAMAVNLSDIAAMAGVPIAAFVSLGLPRNGGAEIATELYRGLRSMADEFNTAVAGGDNLARICGPLGCETVIVEKLAAAPRRIPGFAIGCRPVEDRETEAAHQSFSGRGWPSRIPMIVRA